MKKSSWWQSWRKLADDKRSANPGPPDPSKGISPGGGGAAGSGPANTGSPSPSGGIAPGQSLLGRSLSQITRDITQNVAASLGVNYSGGKLLPGAGAGINQDELDALKQVRRSLITSTGNYTPATPVPGAARGAWGTTPVPGPVPNVVQPLQQPKPPAQQAQNPQAANQGARRPARKANDDGESLYDRQIRMVERYGRYRPSGPNYDVVGTNRIEALVAYHLMRALGYRNLLREGPYMERDPRKRARAYRKMMKHLREAYRLGFEKHKFYQYKDRRGIRGAITAVMEKEFGILPPPEQERRLAAQRETAIRQMLRRRQKMLQQQYRRNPYLYWARQGMASGIMMPPVMVPFVSGIIGLPF